VVKTLTITGGAATTDGSVPPLTVTVELNAYLWALPAADAAAGGTP